MINHNQSKSHVQNHKIQRPCACLLGICWYLSSMTFWWFQDLRMAPAKSLENQRDLAKHNQGAKIMCMYIQNHADTHVTFIYIHSFANQTHRKLYVQSPNGKPVSTMSTMSTTATMSTMPTMSTIPLRTHHDENLKSLAMVWCISHTFNLPSTPPSNCNSHASLFQDVSRE